MQRLNSNDLVGHITENKNHGYELLILPEEYEGVRFISSIGFVDPRKEIGELLWPEKVNAENVQALKIALGEKAYAGQYQQRPAPPGGITFSKDWFSERLEDNYEIIARFISWDTAQSETGDYSACVVGELMPDYRLFIRHVFRAKMPFPKLVETFELKAKDWKYQLREISVESKSSGLSLMQTIQQASPDWLGPMLQAVNPTNDKETRASLASIWCANHSVILPKPSSKFPWLYDFENELFDFPNSKNDDMVDAFSQLIFRTRFLLEAGLKARTEQ